MGVQSRTSFFALAGKCSADKCERDELCESGGDAGNSGEHGDTRDSGDEECAKRSQCEEEMAKKQESTKGGPRRSRVFLVETREGGGW